jgi:hypothetical protein
VLVRRVVHVDQNQIVQPSGHAREPREHVALFDGQTWIGLQLRSERDEARAERVRARAYGPRAAMIVLDLGRRFAEAVKPGVGAQKSK